jgi:general nucleoside transport system ATP-binding protein
MRGIVKQFPGVLANDHVSFTLGPGEIHGLVGENGAGKTTLMNLLYGLMEPDSGTIRVKGKEVAVRTPVDAIRLGIGMVHQHFMLVPSLTVLENIVLGRVETRFGINQLREAQKSVEALAGKYGLKVPLSRRVSQLSVGEMQRVEILKALYRGAEILILDEPTAVLVPQEVEHLFTVLRELAARGHSVILITHKLKEVLAVTDRVTVMRRGKVTGDLATAETTEQELANKMVGRDVVLRLEKPEAHPQEAVLELEGVSAVNVRHQPVLKSIDLKLHRGEILGIAGVEGNGQTELIEVIAGLRHATEGSIRFAGEDITTENVRRRRRRGIGHVPEDRLVFGVAKELSIADNLILNRYNQAPFATYGVLSLTAVEEHCDTLIRRFDVLAQSSETRVGTLSGGNMQKVVLARELEADPEVLIAAQPGRGVDVGAIEEIYRLLIDLRDRGKAVLLVSSELEDIMMLSDRIAVMYEGRIVGVLSAEEATEEQLGLYMSGAKVQAS